MAADQLNKRAKGSNVMQKAKKKKSSHHDLNMKSSISLQWDEKKELVVPKKEQISIARRELIPFLPFVPNYQNALGDVFAAPPELFELNDLTGVLSYEVWQTHLSVQEREFLTRLLPEGLDPHKVVYDLLAGSNLYFGNPFPKWGASICSGDCHPDVILRQEQCNQANKIAYYSELQKYHTKMIGSLQLWKERWASCKNSENDFMQNILRSRTYFHKSGCSHENEIEESRGGTSDSCSWDAANDKSYSSDNPDLTIINGETETIMRDSRMDSENKYYDSSGGRSVARSRKGNKSHRLNVECGDGAKYMSYIKVSKEQHERVKSSMKHSNTSIQPKSLNNVLGNLDSFCVQPYQLFEEEERQKLHYHWLRLAKRDISAGFENWNSLRSAKWQLTKSLMKEMEDKWKSKDFNLYNKGEESRVLILDGEKEDQHLTPHEDNEEQNADSVFQSDDEKAMQIEQHTNESSQVMQIEQHTNESTQDQDSVQDELNLLPPQIDNSQNLCPMAIQTNNVVFTESVSFPCNLEQYAAENMNHGDVEQEYPVASSSAVTVSEEIWPTVSSVPNVYYEEPTSVYNGLHHRIVLEAPEMQQKDPSRSFVPRRSDGADSFFYPYAANTQERNELLLHSLFKEPLNSPYLHDQKLSRLATTESMLMGNSQFPRNLTPPLPLQKNIPENILYSDGSGPHFPSIPIRQQQQQLLSATSHHHHHHQNHNHHGVDDYSNSMGMVGLNSNGIGNWFCDNEVMWQGNQVATTVADESLYSILSQCSSNSNSNSNNGNGVVHYDQFVHGTRGNGVGVNYNEGQYGTRGNGLGWVNVPCTLQQQQQRKLWNDKELG